MLARCFCATGWIYQQNRSGRIILLTCPSFDCIGFMSAAVPGACGINHMPAEKIGQSGACQLLVTLIDLRFYLCQLDQEFIERWGFFQKHRLHFPIICLKTRDSVFWRYKPERSRLSRVVVGPCRVVRHTQKSFSTISLDSPRRFAAS